MVVTPFNNFMHFQCILSDQEKSLAIDDTSQDRSAVRLGYTRPRPVQPRGIFTPDLKSPVSKAKRVWIADSLLAGGGEAGFVECELDERSDLFGSPARCAFVARGGTGGNAKNIRRMTLRLVGAGQAQCG